MPKIIENLEEEIVRVSLELFKQNSYTQVSMRKIAEKLGIAVGTIYNYYPTKWELYLAVFEESWQDTYQKLKDNCESVEEGFLKKFFEVLYFEFKNRKGIVKELFRSIMNNIELDAEEQKEKINRIRFPSVIVNDIYQLFLSSFEKEYGLKAADYEAELERLFTMVRTYIPLMFNRYSDQDQKNIDFINGVVESYIAREIMN